MRGKREPIADRFWQFVDKSGDCWLWTGCTNGKYGRIGDGKSSRTKLAHRASYEMHFGPIPKGLWVLHRCDTPACVNPDHLFLGTRADNMKDAHEKGRIDLSYVARHQRPKARKSVDIR
jgi:hypothetical protein